MPFLLFCSINLVWCSVALIGELIQRIYLEVFNECFNLHEQIKRLTVWCPIAIKQNKSFPSADKLFLFVMWWSVVALEYSNLAGKFLFSSSFTTNFKHHLFWYQFVITNSEFICSCISKCDFVLSVAKMASCWALPICLCSCNVWFYS